MTCDIVFVTSPNWDVSNYVHSPNVSLLPLSATLCRRSPFGECAVVGISSNLQ